MCATVVGGWWSHGKRDRKMDEGILCQKKSKKQVQYYYSLGRTHVPVHQRCTPSWRFVANTYVSLEERINCSVVLAASFYLKTFLEKDIIMYRYSVGIGSSLIVQRIPYEQVCDNTRARTHSTHRRCTALIVGACTWAKSSPNDHCHNFEWTD